MHDGRLYLDVVVHVSVPLRGSGLKAERSADDAVESLVSVPLRGSGLKDQGFMSAAGPRNQVSVPLRGSGLKVAATASTEPNSRSRCFRPLAGKWFESYNLA